MAEYEKFIDEMLEYEQKKYSALISSDPAKIDRAIGEQQAGIKRLELMEQKREELQSELGAGGYSFRDMLDYMGPEEKPAFSRLFENIAERAVAISESNRRSMAFAKNGLEFTRMIADEPAPELRESYAPAGAGKIKKQPETRSGIFESKI